MKCKNAKKLISLYLDKELDKEQEDEFNKHLSLCPDCQKEYGFFKNLETSLPKVEIAPSSNFKVKFWQKLEVEEKKYKQKYGRLVLVPIYAATILFLLITAFSVSMLYAYKSNIKDNSTDKALIVNYINNCILKINLAPIACLEFMAENEACIHEVCCENDGCKYCEEAE